MARLLIPTMTVNRFATQTDLTEQNGDTVNGHYAPNNGWTLLKLRNSGGASITVSVVVPTGVDVNLVAPNRTYTIPAATTLTPVGPFPREVYGDQILVNVSSANARLLAYSAGLNPVPPAV